MYRRRGGQIDLFEDETLFGGVRLDSSNQWVKLVKLIPWEAVEERYADTFGGGTGNPAKSARMAIGSLIVKERYGFSDEDTLQEIRMNPYLQYFLGLRGFQHNAPFDQSTLTLFRRRVTPGMLGELNDFISGRKDPYAKKDAEPPEDEGPEDPPTDETPGGTPSSPENHGTLTLDATCVPQDIRFPTDMGLLNDARESLEGMIDEAFAVGEKPRAYREKARRDYLNYVRNRKPSRKLLRKSLRRQLGYIARDLGYLEVRLREIPGALSEKQLSRLSVIRTLYAQQKEMYDKRENRVADRIVSLHEPWVRPIVRGKSNVPVEFGAKVAISLTKGYARVEKFSWDAFHEGHTLRDAVESYRRDYGFYPERILADKAFRTRENLQYCKERGIRMAGPKLGRPPADKALYRQQRHEEWLESGERAEVECVFGTAKRRYTLDRVMMRLEHTSEVSVYVTFLTLNLWKRLRRFLFALLRGGHWVRQLEKLEAFFDRSPIIFGFPCVLAVGQ